MLEMIGLLVCVITIFVANSNSAKGRLGKLRGTNLQVAGELNTCAEGKLFSVFVTYS